MVDVRIKYLKSLIGKRIMDISDIIMEGLLIAAIVRDGEVIIPNGLTKLMEEDVLHIIGKRNSINKFGINASK